jgi:hypothetical protein
VAYVTVANMTLTSVRLRLPDGWDCKELDKPPARKAGGEPTIKGTWKAWNTGSDVLYGDTPEELLYRVWHRQWQLKKSGAAERCPDGEDGEVE